MLTIKTKLDKSSIAGIGLFADQDVLKSEIVWRMNSLSVLRITPDEYNKLLKIEQDFINDKDYYWTDKDNNYMIPIDDSRFMNHSSDPNVIDFDDNICVATRDIKKNEELTIDYKTLVSENEWKNYYN